MSEQTFKAAAWVYPMAYGSGVQFPRPIKPEGWDDGDWGEEWYCRPLYDQAAIDTLQAENAALRAQLEQDSSKISVDKKALRTVLNALNGPGHLIRELQAIRSIQVITGDSPIDRLIDEFNTAVRKAREDQP